AALSARRDHHRRLAAEPIAHALHDPGDLSRDGTPQGAVLRDAASAGRAGAAGAGADAEGGEVMGARHQTRPEQHESGPVILRRERSEPRRATALTEWNHRGRILRGSRFALAPQ